MRMLNTIDTWNLLEKYEIEGTLMQDDTVEVTDEDYQKLLNNVKNKAYVKACTVK